MKITAFVPTYNEEKRIRCCLQCLKWCDEIFVLDKSSTDRTVEIAREMGANVMVIPHEDSYDPHELDYMLSLDSDWIVLFTCSDLIDKTLALKVRDILYYTEADIIYVPFKQYVLGINHNNSPWYSKERRLAFRKSVIRINPSSVHCALYFSSNKTLTVKADGYMYHLTHATVDGMMDRHIRYWRGEAEGYCTESLKIPLKAIIRAFINTFKKGSLFKGWDIFALFCAYMAYHLMSFVYIWEKKYCNAPQLYDDIKKDVINQWK